MVNRSQLFEYGTDQHIAGVDRFIAEVPSGIDTVAKLFAGLVQALHLPSYFGFNWNALSDCLRDLHWVVQKEVVLIHRELPCLPVAELTEYLDVLAEAVESWQRADEHVIRVVFPDSARPEIIRRLGAPS